MQTEEEKKNKESLQIQALRSGNHSAIRSTLKELRIHGKVSILPEIFDLLADQEDEELILEISSFLNDLKDQEAAEQLSRAILNPEYRAVQTPLVAACWQNGLSYGKFIDTFVEVVLSGSYTSAIEAFTVIEEAVGELEDKERAKVVTKLKSGMLEADEQKQALISELIKVVENY
jgi:HEAT repeat protein